MSSLDDFVRRYEPVIAVTGALAALALGGMLWAEDIRNFLEPTPAPIGPSAAERGRALGRKDTADAPPGVLDRVPATSRRVVAPSTGVVHQASTASHQG